MSRTPAQASLTVVRGATWEDELVYRDENGVAIDLTGYEARMQVHTLAGQYGAAITSKLLELTSDNGLLTIDTPTGESVPCRVLIRLDPADHAMLNPANIKRDKYAWAMELVLPGAPDYVIPLATGKLTVQGNTYR